MAVPREIDLGNEAVFCGCAFDNNVSLSLFWIAFVGRFRSVFVSVFFFLLDHLGRC